MVRYGIVCALLALCLSAPAALAGPEVYSILGVNAGRLEGDSQQFEQDGAQVLSDSIGGTWTAEKKTRAGFDIGVGFGWTGRGILGYAGEVHVAGRGAKWQYTCPTCPDSIRKVTESVRLNYLEIPVLLRLSAPTGNRVRPEVLAGPLVGLRVSSRVNFSIAGKTISQDIGSDVKSSYFGTVFGAGVRFRTTHKSLLLVQARYLLGLTEVFKDEVGAKVKPRDFTFMVGTSWEL